MIVGCNKKDLISPTYEGLSRVDNQVLVNRFLHESPSTSEKARQIIADIKKTEAKHPFLAEYARRYGFPEWEYMFGTSISPGNRQAQKGIDFSNQVVVNSSSTANKSSGFYFIPLQDSITKRVKAYIYCQQYNDSTFTYTTYDVEKIVASTPPNDTAKVNKHITLAVASYFEKQINGKEITNEFKNGIYKNVRIKEVTGQSTSQNAIGLQGGIESNAHPVSSCYHVNIYVIEFSGWPIFLVFKTPCLPEVVVVANPNPSSGGSSNGGSFFSGIMTPPSFTPPSLGGGGTGGGSGSGYTPPPYSSYTPPPNWFDWNFLFQNPNYWSVADPSMLPIGTIYTPELLHLITTLGLNQAQTEWLSLNPLRVSEINNALNRTYNNIPINDLIGFLNLHINRLMYDSEYLNIVDGYSESITSSNPIITSIIKELLLEIGIRAGKKFLGNMTGFSDIEDAMRNASHGDYLEAVLDVIHLLAKKVPWVNALSIAKELYDLKKAAEKVWAVVEKIKRLPDDALKGLMKTLKDKTGGILEKIEIDANSTKEFGKIKYDPNDAENFFRDFANNVGVGVNATSGSALYFDVAGIRIEYYPQSSPISGGHPTLRIRSLSTNWEYKFRFE